MKARNLVLKPLIAAALLCTGTAYAAPPTNPLSGLTSGLNGSGASSSSNFLNLNLTLGSAMNSLPSLDPAGSNGGTGAMNPFSQNSPLHDNAVGHLVFDTANGVRRALPNGTIPTNDARPDLPGLRKDATSELVHNLKLKETTQNLMDAGRTGVMPAVKQPVRELRNAAEDAGDGDDHDNGFLGVNNSSTLGTDDGSDNDGGFLGAGDSSTLGTDNDRDPGDNGFLGAGNSSTLGTD